MHALTASHEITPAVAFLPIHSRGGPFECDYDVLRVLAEHLTPLRVVGARLVGQGSGFSQVIAYDGGADVDGPFQPSGVSEWQGGSQQC